MNQIPSLAELKRYDPNVAGSVEGIAWKIYDTQTYNGAAGQSQLSFFQYAVGQSGKTLAQTNMQGNGQFPAKQVFLATGIEVAFYPGQLPKATDNRQIDDVYTFYKSAQYLELYIGSKPYLDVAPLMAFPPSTGLSGFAALTTALQATPANVNAQRVTYATAAGEPFMLNPEILLIENQNFRVTINAPTLIPLPSTVDATVIVTMNGFLYRNAQ